MPTPQRVEIWNSTEQLRANAAAWDDLWQRSSTASPAARAEPLAVWFDCFSREQDFRAIVVRDEDEQLIAALPLVQTRRWSFLPVARVPKNAWSSAGELMLDSARAGRGAIEQLVAASRKLRCLGIKIEKVNPRGSDWKPVFKQLNSQHLLYRFQRAARVGCVKIAGSWEDYEASRSRNHRQQMRKLLRRLREQGELELRIVSPHEGDEIEPLLRRGFEVEDRSWKGKAGTSVLRHDDVLSFFCRQAAALAKQDHLRLVFLELAGRPIAFEYGWLAKGTYFSPKVGYDAEFSQFSPGQLLRYELLRHFYESAEVILVDFWGPITPATARWTTHSYPVVDAMMVPYGTPGRLAHGLQSGSSALRRFTTKSIQQPFDTAGASRAPAG